MSLVPDEEKVIVQRTQLQPIDPKDSRSAWARFLDGFRVLIGCKPIYLAERYANAKVEQEEVEPEIRLLNAKAEFEKKMAEVRKMDRESEAEADLKRAQAEKLRSETRHAEQSALHKIQSDAIEHLNVTIERIRLAGGSIEFQPPRLDSKTTDVDEIPLDKAKVLLFQQIKTQIGDALEGLENRLAELSRQLDRTRDKGPPFDWALNEVRRIVEKLDEPFAFELNASQAAPGTPFSAFPTVSNDIENLLSCVRDNLEGLTVESSRGDFYKSINDSVTRIARFETVYFPESLS